MLFGSTVLEVAIGIIFVYMLLSLLCSAISEYIESWLNHRGRDLERGIRQLLNNSDGSGDDLAGRLYNHGLIRPLYRGPNKLPSYIPSRTFALALWNMATSATAGDASAASSGAAPGSAAQLQNIKRLIETKIQNRELQEALTTLIDEAKGDFDAARKNIEDWYDGAMDRVSGWYKRRVQMFLLVIGLVVATAINADTVNIAKALVQDSALRSAVVAAAERPAQTDDGATPTERIQANRQALNALGLPLGWAWHKNTSDDPRGKPGDVGSWLLKIFGLVLTALAISQGAPFWFDLLNKFMVIRSTVKPREKSREQPSKDKPAPDTEVESRDDDEDGSKG